MSALKTNMTIENVNLDVRLKKQMKQEISF